MYSPRSAGSRRSTGHLFEWSNTSGSLLPTPCFFLGTGSVESNGKDRELAGGPTPRGVVFRGIELSRYRRVDFPPWGIRCPMPVCRGTRRHQGRTPAIPVAGSSQAASSSIPSSLTSSSFPWSLIWANRDIPCTQALSGRAPAELLQIPPTIELMHEDPMTEWVPDQTEPACPRVQRAYFESDDSRPRR